MGLSPGRVLREAGARGQRRSHVVFLGGGQPVNFSTSPEADQIQWGGGVVAEMFPDLREWTRFSGGGGVVSAIFHALHHERTRFSGGGGGSGRDFCGRCS